MKLNGLCIYIFAVSWHKIHGTVVSHHHLHVFVPCAIAYISNTRPALRIWFYAIFRYMDDISCIRPVPPARHTTGRVFVVHPSQRFRRFSCVRALISHKTNRIPFNVKHLMCVIENRFSFGRAPLHAAGECVHTYELVHSRREGIRCMPRCMY